MRPIKIILLIALLLSVVFTALNNYKNKVNNIKLDIDNNFNVPNKCKKLGLLGCTPHPTKYLENKDLNLIKNIKLTDFLDIKYLEDSFIKTFIICKNSNIDHLLIGYLPIYYVGMKKLYKDKFTLNCDLFFKNIKHDILDIIKYSKKETGYNGSVTLIFPTKDNLEKIPNSLLEPEDRFRFLIKQFPKLNNISNSDLETIAIINNKESPEDEKLIDYLKYEYLYEKPISYEKYNIGKDRFHS